MSEQPRSGSLYNDNDEPPVPPASTEKASIVEDFIDIFFAPSKVFARREHSGFGIPMLVVTVAVGALFLVNYGATQGMMDAEFTRTMAATMRKNPGIKPEMLDGMRRYVEMSQKIGAFIIIPVMIFLTGLFLWLLGKIVGAKESLGTALMVTAYASTPRIIDGVVTSVQALLMDTAPLTGRFQLSLGVGRFFDPDAASPILLAFVGRIDIFTIWSTVLMAIGISVTGKVSRAKGALVAVMLWLLVAAFLVLSAARSS